MAGVDENDQSAKAQEIEDDTFFVWDEESKLYFHASTGFYHDPNTGWYYSSRDCIYYTFENGSYVPFAYNKEQKSTYHKCTSCISSEPAQIDSCFQQHSPSDRTTSEPPPSQWIEETLIDLYLSGYNNAAIKTDNLLISQRDEQSSQLQFKERTDHLASEEINVCQNGTENQRSYEWAPNHELEMDMSTDMITSKEEEKWQAQYGQVADEDFLPFSVVDLWDWEMFTEIIKKNRVARLIGRLCKRPSKMHPSVPASGGLLKTATIHDVHLNLVRVATGRVYRLRSPGIKYLVSLSTYDSSNPTKDWDFPDIFDSNHEHTPVRHDEGCNLDGVDYARPSIAIDELSSMDDKKSRSTYKDRAAERRTLHGGFGLGPGQKSVLLDDNCASPESSELEVLYEARNASFGPGSYARKVLESMGWKHGESLGRSNKGILEPLRPVANKGCAGLGWNAAREQA